ncbi:MAG TPA: helix-turn-helix transcriptional regulator [Pseudonocardiaceae bacterium]|nr:helix-turn-helix transcriptional regulator [Pseudonocardiaceae bacterium]
MTPTGIEFSCSARDDLWPSGEGSGRGRLIRGGLCRLEGWLACEFPPVHISGTPERLSLRVLSAFCDILDCTPAELVATTAENAGVRKTATDARPAPASVAIPRPRPARILADE